MRLILGILGLLLLAASMLLCLLSVGSLTLFIQSATMAGVSLVVLAVCETLYYVQLLKKSIDAVDTTERDERILAITQSQQQILLDIDKLLREQRETSAVTLDGIARLLAEQTRLLTEQAQYLSDIAAKD